RIPPRGRFKPRRQSGLRHRCHDPLRLSNRYYRSDSYRNLLSGIGPRGVAVSPDGSRVYTSNAGANTISVIDTRSGNPLATIVVDNDPGRIAVMAGGRRVFSTNELSDSLSVIDAESNAVIASLPVGDNPD